MDGKVARSCTGDTASPPDHGRIWGSLSIQIGRPIFIGRRVSRAE